MLINIFAVLLVLGTLVIVHEFGHYAAAKFFGVRVEVFSVGFGKRLFGFRRGDTDYRVSLLPLGGYVKMSGENPMETPTGDPAEFARRAAQKPPGLLPDPKLAKPRAGIVVGHRTRMAC